MLRRDLLFLTLLSYVRTISCQRFDPPGVRNLFRPDPRPRHNDRFRQPPDRTPIHPPPPPHLPYGFSPTRQPYAGATVISEHFRDPPPPGLSNQFSPPRRPFPPRQRFPNQSFRGPPDRFPPHRGPPTPGRNFGNNLPVDTTHDSHNSHANPAHPPNNRHVNNNNNFYNLPPPFYNSKPHSSTSEYVTKAPYYTTTTAKAVAYEKTTTAKYYEKPEENVKIYRESGERQMNAMLNSMEMDGTLREAGWKSAQVRPMIGQAFPVYKSVRDMLLAREKTRLEMINLKKKYHAKRSKLKNYYRLKPYKI